MIRLPEERNDDASQEAVLELEHRVCVWMLWSTPILFLAGWSIACLYGRTLVFRLPSESAEQLTNFKLGALGGFAFVVPIFVWWGGIRLHRSVKWLRHPVLACCGAVAGLVVACVGIASSPGSHLLQESIKARAPQLDFVRNIVFQEQSLAVPASKREMPKIGLVGSSQVMLGIDADQLEESVAGETHRACMPGMVPLQYLALSQSLADKKLTHVVCWLSEFDFYREQTLPTIRLRWCSNLENLPRICRTLDPKLFLRNRSEIADLAFAAVCPLWQQRSLIQKGAFRFWWRFDNVTQTLDKDEQLVGGKLVGKQQGVKNAKKNIQQTPLLSANTSAFEMFARTIIDSGAKLIVIEGESHPETMKAYPAEFRTETRSMLEGHSRSIGFEFIPAASRPSFDIDDWRDAVHLNKKGRDKLTRFVAQRILSNDLQ